MDKMIGIQKQLLPDLLSLLRKRYEILRHIHLMQPVGRRSLSTVLKITERVLRAEVDFLRGQGLVEVNVSGMQLSQQGVALVIDMDPLVKELFGLSQLEEELCKLLDIKEVIIIPGDTDQSEWVKKELGRAGAQTLKKLSVATQVVAVAGGTTALAVAEMMTPIPHLRTSIFVPTRGGLGESVELEANYIVSLLAKNTGGTYRLLHVPDQLSDTSYQSMLQEPQIQNVLTIIRKARIVLHGIGDAQRMAVRRNSPPEILNQLEQAGAVGESFGFYFNDQGEIVSRVQTIGLQYSDLEKVTYKIAVAGGASKAKAIKAVCAQSKRQYLITDEAAAKAILHG